MNHPMPDSYWVVPDALLAGEYPWALDDAGARDKCAALLDAGVRSFVDLTEADDCSRPYEETMAALARDRGIDVRYRRMPIRDLGVPTREHMAAVLDYITSEIDAGRPVYVHCLGGIGRTGTVVGCWLVAKDGCTAGKAIARIAELRRDSLHGWRRSPETRDQCKFIEEWAGTSSE